MWDKLAIAMAIAGASMYGGYKLGTYHGQTALHDCQQARSRDQAAQERRTAQRAISNAETITRLRNERDAEAARTNEISRRAAQRDAAARREIRDREQALESALAVGGDCVVAPDAIRLLDDAAGNPRLPGPTGASRAASALDDGPAPALPPLRRRIDQ